MPIQTVEQLREHLALAMQVELSTIPPYLFAMYSIENGDTEAARLLRSIVAEEMLHLALAANILVAVGGQPDFLGPDITPSYPGLLAHHSPDLPLHLAPLSPELIGSTFLVIEQPDPVGIAPEGSYDSLGEFYAGIERAIERLSREGPLFVTGHEHRQVSNEHFYGVVEFNAAGSGGLLFVDDLATAQRAIEIIIHQGEGLADHHWADPSHQELTHYAKLLRMMDGFSAVGPIRQFPIDPRRDDYPEPARSVATLFDAVYRCLFHVLDALYRPGGSQGRLVGSLYVLMADLLGPLAHRLATIPLADGAVAGPTFERIDLGPQPAATLERLAADAIAADPGVSVIVDRLHEADPLASLS